MKAVSVALFAGIVACASLPPLATVKAATATEKVLLSFGGSDGQYPQADLIAVNGTLYGTTVAGGLYSEYCFYYTCGTVFSIDIATGAAKVLYRFCIQQDCDDGAIPSGGLVAVNGTLYGTTEVGGSFSCSGRHGGDLAGCGTAFSLDPNTGAETVLHVFGVSDGLSYPSGGLIDVNGTFYGATLGGGPNYGGAVYALDPNTGAEKVIYFFCSKKNCADGGSPAAALINRGDRLYGTTSYGGAGGGGTVFAIDLTTGREKTLYSFCSQVHCSDGKWPQASLTELGGMLYGTTASGGPGGGTVFMLDPKTGSEHVLHSFCMQVNCADGQSPYGGLVDLAGVLYGTTEAGGANACGRSGCGTAFAIGSTSSSSETVLYSFCSQQNCTDGEQPAASLTAVDGTLYGTTVYGGAHGYGTVFALTNSRRR